VLISRLGINDVPYFNVGQNPLQGDLNYARMLSFTDSNGAKPDPNLPLIEE